MSLREALERLYARIPLGMRLGLEPMRAACAAAGDPQESFATVHVAGTNGKGSVCAMVEAVARAHGLRTGLYTSPHLCRFAERIRIDGEPIGDDLLTSLLSQTLNDAPDLSFFETATLTAFHAFRAAKVDVAVIEVGMGGRLDATNVLRAPRAAAITRIAMDHADRLGATLADIAREKAGIAKPGLDLVLGPIPSDLREVIDAVAGERGATTSSAGGAPVPPVLALRGAHQRDNAAVASVLGARIGAPPDAIARGLAEARWPGRLEHVGRTLLDAAHNPDGAEALAAYVSSLGAKPEATSLVFGTLAEKAWGPMLDRLGPLAADRVYVAPRAAGRSAVNPAQLAERLAGRVAPDLGSALDLAKGELVIVAGSMFIVGEARARLLSLPTDPPVAL